jgi:hypothetical protein
VKREAIDEQKEGKECKVPNFSPLSPLVLNFYAMPISISIPFTNDNKYAWTLMRALLSTPVAIFDCVGAVVTIFLRYRMAALSVVAPLL